MTRLRLWLRVMEARLLCALARRRVTAALIVLEEAHDVDGGWSMRVIVADPTVVAIDARQRCDQYQLARTHLADALEAQAAA